MAESRPAGQTKGQEGTAQAVEAGTGILRIVRDAAQLCRREVRRAKAWLELNLARDAKNKKKGFYRYVSQKRKVKESVLADELEHHLIPTDEKKAEVFSSFLKRVEKRTLGTTDLSASPLCLGRSWNRSP